MIRQNRFFYPITFLILLILLGCKDDEPQFYETNSKIAVKRINFSKFEKTDNLKPIFRDIKNLRTLSRDGENSLKLDTINILQATKDSITNYSFKILNTLSNNKIKNLVISEKNNELKYYVVTYQKLSEDSNDLSLVSSVRVPTIPTYINYSSNTEIADIDDPDCVEITVITLATPRWFGDDVEPEIIEVVYDFSACYDDNNSGNGSSSSGDTPISGGDPFDNAQGNGNIPTNNTTFPQGAFVSNTENYTRTIQDFLTENNFTETSLESIWVENHPIFANTFGQAIEMFPDNPETVLDILYYLMEHDTLPYSGIDFQEVFDFLQNNNNSPEAQNFALQAIKALMDGGEVDFDEMIIVDLSEREKCIYDLITNTPLYKQTIGTFNVDSGYAIYIKNGECSSPNADACTDANELYEGCITINIQNYMEGLDFAATLLHEAIHAELFKYIHQYDSGVEIGNREQLLYYYFYYKAENENTLNTALAQHQYMADNYVKPIAETMRQLDNNQYPLEYYMGFGWDGLRDYGYDGYYDNGNWVSLNNNIDTQYYQNQSLVNQNTIFANNCN